jgi:hypothetical protein
MATLNEAERRRPDFQGGRPVVMADGREWFLARPRIRFVPADNDVGFATYLDGPGDGYNELLERRSALRSRPDATLGELVALDVEIAKRLLTANYDLTTAELAQLIRFGYDAEDAEGERLVDDVLSVAFGQRAPKPSAGGGDSSP